MKIAFFSSGLAYKLGGPAFSEALLVRELSKSIKVDVYLPKERYEQEFLDDFGINGIIPYKRGEVHLLAEQLKSSDIIHLNGHWKWWYSNISRFATQFSIPYVLHARGMLLVGHRRKQVKRVFNFAMGNSIVQNAARVIALSKYEKRQFLPYKVSEDRIAIIPNPIEVPLLVQGAKPKLPSGVNEYFLYLGRIERRKNLVFLVRAFKLYKDLGGKCSLIILGPVERDYDLEIRASIKNYHLQQDVLLLPPAYGKDRDRFLQHTKALIYPATDEPFGRVPFEAIALGVIPIVPDLSGAAEYLGPFLPDCIYRENDLSDLAKTLMRSENTDRERVQEAKEWVREKLNTSVIAEEVLKVYNQVSEGSITSTINRDLSTRGLSERSAN